MIRNFCLICDKELDPAFPNMAEDSAQCSKAVMFTAAGNYGSTVWDPFLSGLALVVNICDDCLVAKADRVIKTHTVHATPSVLYGPWTPGEIDE